MKSVIVAHGYLKDDELLKRECSSGDVILCADGAAEYLYRNGIIPDYLIGDFDSIDLDIYEYFKRKDVKILEYPRNKDYTDTEICVYKAIELKSTIISIVSGIGDRIDHSLGNIGLLHIIALHGIKGYIVSDDSCIYLCKDFLELEGEAGDTVSILPYKDDILGITLSGFEYPLNNANIEFGKPIGLSNVMLKSICSVKIKKGEALVIKQRI